MPEHFYDTSAAVKHYRAEIGTTKVDGLLADTASRHFLSALAIVEIHSVFARLVRTGILTTADFVKLRSCLLAEIASGLWCVVQVTSAGFQEAQDLLVRHGCSRGVRTLDAIQLAVALELNSTKQLDKFVCADANLCSIAATEGLTVINPEVP